MPQQVQVNADIYSRSRSTRSSVFECLRQVGLDWQFLPGTDFTAPAKEKTKNFRVHFITRVRQFLNKNEMAPEVAFKYRWQDDGSVIIRSFERSAEELAEYHRREDRRLKTIAEKQLAKEGGAL